MAPDARMASSSLAAIALFPPLVGQRTIDFGYLYRDVAVQLILYGPLLQWKKSNRPNERETELKLVSIHETLMSDFLARTLD